MKSDKAFIDLTEKITTLAEAGQIEEAIEVGHQALTCAEQMSGSDQQVYLFVCLRQLGRLYGTQRRYVEAEPLLERALAVAENYYSSNDPRLVDALMNLGLLHDEQSQYAQAEPYYYRAVGIIDQELRNNRDKDTLLVPLEAATNQLIKIYQATNRNAEAAGLSMRLASLKRWYKRWVPFLFILLLVGAIALTIGLILMPLPYDLRNNVPLLLLIGFGPIGLLMLPMAIIAKRPPVPRLAPLPRPEPNARVISGHLK